MKRRAVDWDFDVYPIYVFLFQKRSVTFNFPIKNPLLSTFLLKFNSPIWVSSFENYSENHPQRSLTIGDWTAVNETREALYFCNSRHDLDRLPHSKLHTIVSQFQKGKKA